jgi:hypothetical protein
MRDVAIGYVFISTVVLILWISIFVRKRRLQRRLTDLKEELGEER